MSGEDLASSGAMSSSQQPPAATSQPQQTSATVLSGAAASQLIARLREAQANGGGGNVQLANGANAGTIKIQVSLGAQVLQHYAACVSAQIMLRVTTFIINTLWKESLKLSAVHYKRALTFA